MIFSEMFSGFGFRSLNIVGRFLFCLLNLKKGFFVRMFIRMSIA